MKPEYQHVWVLYDEIYERLMFNDDDDEDEEKEHISFASFVGMKNRTLTVNGYSKCYAMTGYRIGYLCGPESFISIFGNTHSHLTHSPSVISQKVAEITYTLDNTVFCINNKIYIVC